MRSAALPWIQNPIETKQTQRRPLSSVPLLDPKIRALLQTSFGSFLLAEVLIWRTVDGVSDFLAPQCAMWDICCGGQSIEHDVCLCFPTGSGKTLAYALPILQSLIQEDPQRVHCLRALILLPTVALMEQVLAVMVPYCRGLNLRLGCLGLSTLSEETEMLQTEPHASPFIKLDGSVDILLATTGRLVTHLDHTLGFSLQYLRFLVLDEADHLMKRRHNDVVSVLMDRLKRDTSSRCINSGRVQKIVVSATVSQDVHQLKMLELHAPRMLCSEGSSEKRYQFPGGLKHFKVVVPAPLRPLALVGLLQRFRDGKTIVFSSTSDLCHKLGDMLSKVGFLKERVVKCTGELSKASLKKALKHFTNGRSGVLVASDVMARGMDVDQVDHVISYDAPSHKKTYIHRVGRTARVHRTGTACCLLRKGIDEKAFLSLNKKLGIRVESLSLNVEELRQLKPEVDRILAEMPTRRPREQIPKSLGVP